MRGFLQRKARNFWIGWQAVEAQLEREQKEKEVEEQIKKDIAPDEGREKINYMLLKAKDQVNDAFKVLFAKDSKLHQVKAF